MKFSVSETTSQLGCSTQQMDLFRATIECLYFTEINMVDATYTWWNKRKGTASIHAELNSDYTFYSQYRNGWIKILFVASYSIFTDSGKATNSPDNFKLACAI